MRCNKCGGFITVSQTRCNNCYQTTGFGLREMYFPQSDMYGNTIYEIQTNEHKTSVRKKYLNNLPEYKEANKIQKKHLKIVLTLAMSIFVVTGLLMWLVDVVVDLGVDEAVATLWLFVIMLLFFVVVFVSIIIINKNFKQPLDNVKDIMQHDKKNYYYANGYVIGYSVFDHSVRHDDSTYRYYGHYEIDRRNIKGISYDSYFAEYILHLYKPVYTHYDFEPTTEFRLADVFDDIVLTKVFGCDLPPKNIPF